MAQQFKGIWLVLILLVSGVVMFFLTVSGQKVQEPQGVVLQDMVKAVGQKVEPAQTTQVVDNTAAVEKPVLASQDPVPSPAIVTDTESGKETDFAVQVYSFQDKNRATAAIEALKAANYQPYLVVSDLGEKGTWYRVRVGGLKDELAAKTTLEDIRKNYNGGFIVKPTAAPAAVNVQQPVK